MGERGVVRFWIRIGSSADPRICGVTGRTLKKRLTEQKRLSLFLSFSLILFFFFFWILRRESLSVFLFLFLPQRN